MSAPERIAVDVRPGLVQRWWPLKERIDDDVEYVRADLLAAAEARVAELERRLSYYEQAKAAMVPPRADATEAGGTE